MVDEGEVGAVAAVAEGAQEEGDFVAGQDVRKGFFAFDFDLGPDLPFEAEVVAVKGAKSADGLVDGGASEVTSGLEVEEEVEDLSALESGQVLIRMVVGKLPDPTEVGFDGALAEPFELGKARVLLIPLFGNDDVVLPICFFLKDCAA